ncbi:MAG: hypothetical protein ACI4AD_05345 [Roseburia sp.]
MKSYERPIVLQSEELMEGIYTASGDVIGGGGGTGSSENTAKCDSIYMKGVWQAPDYSDWAGGTRGYRQQFGCLGCPANTGSGCGLLSHYVDSGFAGSYDVDNGNRKPSWEKKGYGPDDTVTDWAM